MEDPFAGKVGKLNEAAIAMHELYESFLSGGFNEEQAMTLTTEAFKVIMGGQANG